MTFALMTKGKVPKQVIWILIIMLRCHFPKTPMMSTFEDILKRDDQERDKTIVTLQVRSHLQLYFYCKTGKSS